MSQENVEIVRRVSDAYNRRDVGAMLDELHPQIEWHNQRGRSKATGIPVHMRFAQVWTLRNGQAIRMQMYASPDDALEAVGLSE